MLDREKIEGICEDLYVMTGIKAVFFDAEMKIVYQHPVTMGEFCGELRRDRKMEERCLACDRMGMEGCRKTRDFYLYACHMGLMEAVAPVMDNGVVLGYVMFGQALQAGTGPRVREEVEKIEDPERRRILLEALKRMKPADEGKLRAGARMIGMCASYVHLQQLMQNSPEVRSEQVRRLVQANLSDPSLRDEAICRALGVSRGTLYNICREAFGTGISTYIRKERVRLALRLLRSTGLSLSEIALRTGISDPDYLSRLVKKATGQSPRKLRAEAGKEQLT